MDNITCSHPFKVPIKWKAFWKLSHSVSENWKSEKWGNTRVNPKLSQDGTIFNHITWFTGRQAGRQSELPDTPHGRVCQEKLRLWLTAGNELFFSSFAQRHFFRFCTFDTTSSPPNRRPCALRVYLRIPTFVRSIVNRNHLNLLESRAAAAIPGRHPSTRLLGFALARILACPLSLTLSLVLWRAACKHRSTCYRC